MADLESDGYLLSSHRLSDSQCELIASSIPSVSGGRAGVRNLIQHPTVVRLLLHARLGELAREATGRDLVAVKATLFDKTPATNWRAQWHQDRTLAVKARLDVPGFGPWTTKSGAIHVDAPAYVLRQMIAARIHIDESGPENGSLRVIPGSHLLGKATEHDIADILSISTPVELYAPKGAIILMRPLLLHASTASLADGHRRVLHIELAPPESISPLSWHDAVPLNRAA